MMFCSGNYHTCGDICTLREVDWYNYLNNISDKIIVYSDGIIFNAKSLTLAFESREK